MPGDPFDQWFDRDDWSAPLTDGPWDELMLFPPTPVEDDEE